MPSRGTGIVTLRGHLDGGYVPPDGVALRLLIDLPDRARPYEPLAFRTDAQGNFVIHWSWGTGSGVVTYPLAVATTATESDFPFTASRSRGSASPSAVQRLSGGGRTTGSAARHKRVDEAPVLASVTGPSTIGSDERSDSGVSTTPNWGRWQPRASRQGATAAARQVVAAATD